MLEVTRADPGSGFWHGAAEAEQVTEGRVRHGLFGPDGYTSSCLTATDVLLDIAAEHLTGDVVVLPRSREGPLLTSTRNPSLPQPVSDDVLRLAGESLTTEPDCFPTRVRARGWPGAPVLPRLRDAAVEAP